MNEPAKGTPRIATVLVVDDDPAVLGSLKFSLEVEGFAVAIFTSADEFLLVPPPPNSCILIDQNLPGISGLALYEELHRRGIRTPAVLITSYPSELVRRRAAAAGVPIVEKPFLNNTLVETIRSVLQARS